MSCDICKARDEGKSAYYSGKELKDNPYYDPSEDIITLVSEAWKKGWIIESRYGNILSEYTSLKIKILMVLRDPPILKRQLISRLNRLIDK